MFTEVMMRLVLGLLLGLGLLLQAIDIILSPHRKIIIKEKFTLFSSRLVDYSLKELALWSLGNFSSQLDRWFGSHPFSHRSCWMIMKIHLFLFLAMLLILLLINQFSNRSLDKFGFVIIYYSALFHVYAIFGLDPLVLLELKREVIQERFFNMVDLSTCVFLSLSFLLSSTFSYLSLGITRIILRKALCKSDLKRIASFLFVDCMIAAATALSFTAMITIANVMVFVVATNVAFSVGWFTRVPELFGSYLLANAYILMETTVEEGRTDIWLDLTIEKAGAMKWIATIAYENMIKYVIDLKRVLALEWREIPLSTTAKNWAWSLCLLPSAAYLMYMGAMQIVARVGWVQRGVAAYLGWLAKLDKGPVYVIGWSLLAIFAVLRYFFV